jgi:hypothetical protein
MGSGFPTVGRIPPPVRIGWAMLVNHLPLLYAILHHEVERGFGFGFCLRLYLEQATQVFLELDAVSHEVAQQTLREFSGRSTETFPSSGDWQSWPRR